VLILPVCVGRLAWQLLQRPSRYRFVFEKRPPWPDVDLFQKLKLILGLKKHGSFVQAFDSKYCAIQETRKIQGKPFFYPETHKGKQKKYLKIVK